MEVEQLEKLKEGWNEAELILFPSFKEFEKWCRENKVEILVSTKTEQIFEYLCICKGKKVIAKVKPTVDDFYIPKDAVKQMLSEDYVAEKAEAKDFVNPAVVAKNLRDLFYELLDTAILAGDFIDMSPEDAKKLLDMAEYVEKTSKLLKKRILNGIKGYMAGVVFGTIKDERWTPERVEKAFKN